MTGKSKTVATTLASFALTFALALLAASASANHDTVTQISSGNGAEDANYRGASTDGTRVFFDTQESLSVSDTDAATDIYERQGGTTTLISAGAINGNGAFGASFVGASADGTRVFFETREALVSADTDSGCGAGGTQPCTDVYERSSGTTTLVSAGGSGSFDAAFKGVSQDGLHVFFETREQMSGAGDTDSNTDVYERFGGTTTRVSQSNFGSNGAFDSNFAGVSADGTKVFFDTREKIRGTDTDSSVDVYQRFAANTTQVSLGQVNGNGAFDVFYAGASQDGARVFFHTQEQLTSADPSDGRFDVYERSSGTTTLVSAGQVNGNGAFDAFFKGASADGTRVFFESSEVLASADGDTDVDVYQRSSGTTSLVSVGTQTAGAGRFAHFRGASADGTKVFFDSDDRLLAADTDSQPDVYERTSGTTTSLLSVGLSGGNGPLPAGFDGASQDGARVFFHTDESLLAEDPDVYTDVYERYRGQTTLISRAAGPYYSDFSGASQTGAVAFFHTLEPILGSDTDTYEDVYQAKASYELPGSAPSLDFALVPAFRQCGTGGNPVNAGHPWSPSATTSCSSTTPQSNLARVGTTNTGAIHLTAASGDFTITETNSDIQMPTGADYNPSPPGTADLKVIVRLRLTDRSSCAGTSCSAFYERYATLTDLDFGPVPIECTTNGSTATPPGSDCNLTTSANTFMAGAIASGRQTVVQAFRVRINDSANVLFQQEGYLAP